MGLPYPLEEFTWFASNYSIDYASALNGGDLGYFSPGIMVSDFENAVFSIEEPGLIDYLIESDYGYHLIYVTEAPKEVPMQDISDYFADSGSSYYYQYFIWQNTLSTLISNNIESFYELPEESGDKAALIIDGQETPIMELLDDTPIVAFYDISYDWGFCKEITSLFASEVDDTMNQELLNYNLENLNDLLFYYSRYESEADDYSEDYETMKADVYKDFLSQIGLEKLNSDWMAEAQTEVTSGNYPDIESFVQEKYSDWKETAITNYHVNFYDENIREFFSK